MRRSFYIAASSDTLSRTVVQRLATALKQQFPWNWHNSYDWTHGFQEECNYPRHELLWRAKMDRVGAREADVFIFFEGEPRSLGANREYGVRWGAEKTIYRVSTEPDHLFDMLDNVVTVTTIEDLLKILETRENI